MSRFDILKRDLISSSVLFLVAVPLCLGIALASNAPLFSGILAGIIGGIVVGRLSQSHISVSGPAAGMIALVISAIAALGDYSAVLVALCLAGMLQMLIGRLRAGFIADFVPSNVIQGLLCAIGIVIIIKQVPFALGYFAKPQSLLNELREAQESLEWQPLLSLTKHISFGAMLISACSLALLFGWQKLKKSPLRYIPGPVVVVLLGVVTNYLFMNFVPALYLGSTEHLVTLPAVSKFLDLKNLFVFPDFTVLANPKVYFYAIVFAIVASLETLLNLEAAERLDPHKRYCSRNRELMAQGLGNLISGLLGGLPITSVIVRSSVNIQSGGKTKNSTTFHGMWLLLSVLLIPTWLNRIPLASLAAILIFVGLKLANYQVFHTMYRRGLAYFLPFIVTVVMIIAEDLLTGILCGLAVSAFLVMKSNSKPRFKQAIEVYPFGKILRLSLPQQVTFLNKASLINALRSLPDNSQVIIDGSQTTHMDYDISEAIEEFSVNLSRDKNISLRLEGFKETHRVSKRSDFNHITSQKVQADLGSTEVLSILKEGNKRFVANAPLNRCLASEVQGTAKSQHPVAVFLSCIDSRVPIETVFDLGLGDAFVTRVAGNVVNPDVIASLEFACLSGAKLVVVMGHSECGAIKAACEQDCTGNLGELLDKIKPSVLKTQQQGIADVGEFRQAVTEENIKSSMQALQAQSSLLAEMIEENKISIVSALYDVNSGQVRFDNLVEPQSVKPMRKATQASAIHFSNA